MAYPRFARYLGFSAALLGACLFVYHRSSEDKRRMKQWDERLAALEAAGSGQTERIIERVVRMPASPAVTPDPPDETNRSRSPAAPAPPSSAELTAALASAFHNEPVDAAWAGQAERSVLPAVKTALPASSRLLSLECRSQFCDVTVVHESVEASNGFILDLFAMNRGGPLAESTGGFRAGDPTPTEDGKLLFHLYVARPGASLALDPPLAEAPASAEHNL